MNIDLLQRIKTAILAEPDKFRMDTWSCGTAHCIAGWALHLNGLTIANPDALAPVQRLADGRSPETVAMDLLGIESWEDSDALFVSSCWPIEYRIPYCNAGSRAERAQIAATRIDSFIASGGKDWDDYSE